MLKINYKAKKCLKCAMLSVKISKIFDKNFLLFRWFERDFGFGGFHENGKLQLIIGNIFSPQCK